MTRRLPEKSQPEGLERRSSKQKHLVGKEFFDAMEEPPILYDPFDKKSIFLSQKLKQELCHCSNSKNWSNQLQEELLHRINPEFQKRFPAYRLRASSLKRSWEKIQHYSAQIQEQKDTLTQDGKLNIPFLIKENLKATAKLENTCHIHPSHYAHQLAIKMSECIAVVDGVRPKLDQLTQTIWAASRHILPKPSSEPHKATHHKQEKIDCLIVKSILEITAKHPDISQAELIFHIQKRFIQLRTVISVYSPGQLMKMLTALLADQFHCASQRMEKTLEQIPYPTAKCLKSELALILIDSPHLSPEEATEEAFTFFEKAGAALEKVLEEELERKIQNWAIQSDMLLRFARINQESALFYEIEKVWNETQTYNLQAMVSNIYQNFVEKYPRLLFCAKDIEIRIWIGLKSLWYTRAFREETPTFDRFILWHKHLLTFSNLSPKALLEAVEKRCKKMVPLMPFGRARLLLVTEEKQDTYQYERNAQ